VLVEIIFKKRSKMWHSFQHFIDCAFMLRQAAARTLAPTAVHAFRGLLGSSISWWRTAGSEHT
jgi:hypothetical protein